jgi:hypothetical protein
VTAPPRATARPVRYRYHFTDFRLGVLLATLPMTGVKLTTVLSGASTAEGVVPLASASVRARDPFTATVTRRSCLWAERQELDAVTGRVADTRLMWGGVIMGRARGHASRAMKVTAVSWESYLQRRLTGSATHKQRDKFFIMRHLVHHAAQQPIVGDPEFPAYPFFPPHLAPLEVDYDRIDAPPWLEELDDLPLSGVKADRTYLASDLKPVLESCNELASSGTGFDWRLVPEFGTPGDLSTMRVRLDLGYPRLGRTEPADLRWSTDPADARTRWGYIDDLTIAEDGAGVHNQVTALGEGSGPNQLRWTANSRDTSRDEETSGYPLYETSLASSTSDLRTLDSVRGHAEGALLGQLSSETTISGVRIRGDLAPTLTAWDVGDDATLRIGETTTGQATTVIGQITGRTIEPPEQDSTERVTIDVQGQVA